MKALRETARTCADVGVRTLTLFAFSTENWMRPSREVGMLMDLMRHVMDNDIQDLHERRVRLRILGDRERFEPDIRERMAQCEALTAQNDQLNLNVALNFGGRWDITQAAKALAEQVQQGVLSVDQIDEETFARYTSLGSLPNPDILIRTGGEHRISNFLLWDLAYTELFFTDRFWPEFDRKSLLEVLSEYSGRCRRYGGRDERSSTSVRC